MRAGQVRTSRASERGLWLAVMIVVLVTGGVSFALVPALERGPRPPFLTTTSDSPAPVYQREGALDVLRIAGSGSNVPLTRGLAEAFASQRGHQVVVHESIGSRGGIRATLDGAVDLGLVSREVRDDEGEGLVVTPYARSAVLVVAHSSVPDTGLTRRQLLDLYAGRHGRWSDGSRVVVLQRERGDSSHRAVERAITEFRATNEKAWEAGMFRVLYRDAEMQEALAGTPGSVGLYGLGEIPRDLPLRALAFEGVEPTPENLSNGSYPFTKQLAFVSLGPPRGLAADFVAFVLSDEGMRIIRDRGYTPAEAG